MKNISTKELFKNAFRALIKPHKAFKEIPFGKKINYKIIIPLLGIWGLLYIIINYFFTNQGGSILSFPLFFGMHVFIDVFGTILFWIFGVLSFYFLAKIFRKRVPIQKIEIGVFYVFLVRNLTPLFDFVHLMGLRTLTISFLGGNINIRFGYLFAFIFLPLLSYFLIRDVLKFKNKELMYAGIIAFFVPLLGRFFLQQIPHFLNEILKVFHLQLGYDIVALLAIGILFPTLFFYRFYIEKKILFKNFLKFSFTLSFVVIILWSYLSYFTPLFKKDVSRIGYQSIESGSIVYTSGFSRVTNSKMFSVDLEALTRTLSSKTDGTSKDQQIYDASTFNLDFDPTKVVITAVRCNVAIHSTTSDYNSDNEPTARCDIYTPGNSAWNNGTTTWTNLSGASNQTQTWTNPSWGNQLRTTGNDIRIWGVTDGNGNSSSPDGDIVAYNDIVLEIDYKTNLKQNYYRFYVNANAVDPTTVWPEDGGGGGNILEENDPIGSDDSPPGNGDIVRIRTSIQLETGTMTANTEAFKLQFASKGAGTCSSPTGSWTDVGGLSSGSVWRGYDNGSATGGSSVGSSLLLSPSDIRGRYTEANPSANNEFEATSGQDIEYDWVIQYNSASVGTYCFRVVDNAGSNPATFTYTNYPEVYAKGKNIDQKHFRWRNDSYGLNTNSGWLKAEDTTAGADQLQDLRLRFSVANIGDASGSTDYRIEYGTKSTTCSAIASWTAVPVTATTEPFDMIATSQYADGDATTSNFLTATGTWANGEGVEDPSNKTGSNSLTNGYYTEYEYAIEPTTNATKGNTYCFRLTDNGTVLDVYTTYTELTIKDMTTTLYKSADTWFGAIPVYMTLTGMNNTDYPYARVKVDTPASQTFYTTLTWDAGDSRFEGIIYPGSNYCAGCADPTTGSFTVTGQLDDDSGFGSINYTASAGTFSTSIARRKSSIDEDNNYSDYNCSWGGSNWTCTFKDMAIYASSSTSNGVVAIPFIPNTANYSITNVYVDGGTSALSQITNPFTTGSGWWFDSTSKVLYVRQATFGTTYSTSANNLKIVFTSDTDLWATRFDRVQTSDMGDRLFYNGLLINNLYYTTSVYGGGHEGSGNQAESRAHESSADNNTTDCMERVAVHVDNTTRSDGSGYYNYNIKWRQDEWASYITSQSNNAIRVVANDDTTASTGWAQYLNNGISVERTQDFYASKFYIKNKYVLTNTSASAHTYNMAWGREQWINGSPCDNDTCDEGRTYGDVSDRTVESSFTLSSNNPWFTAYDTGNFGAMGVCHDKDDMPTYAYFLVEAALTNTAAEWDGTSPMYNTGSSGSTAVSTFFEDNFGSVAAGNSYTYTFWQANYDTTSWANIESNLDTSCLEFNRTFNQSGYRFFDNTNSTDVGAPLAAQNTGVSLADGKNFRLRMLARVGNYQLGSSADEFKLQFASKGAGTCSSPTGSWTDVGASTAIAFNNNSSPADDAALTPNYNDPTDGAYDIVRQSYEESNNLTNSKGAIPVDDNGLWDFSLKENTASAGTTYCFRMMKTDGEQEFDTYSYYPEVTITAGSITQSKYRFYNDNSTTGVDSNTEIANTDTALTSVPKGQRFLARIQLDETASGALSSAYKLQYDKTGDGQWTDVSSAGAASSNSGGDYKDWNTKALWTGGSAADGTHSSMAIGTDGYPVVSLRSTTNSGDLIVCKCSDTSCIQTPTCTTVDSGATSSDNVGNFNAISISNDNGKPIITHVDVTNSKLRVCKCGNTSCSSGNSCTTVQDQTPADVTAGNARISMAIGTDGYPVVSLNNGSNALRICKCGNDTCTSSNTCTTISNPGNNARWSSIAIGSDGYPVVSFDYWDGGSLKLVHCTNASCSTSDSVVTMESGGVGSSIAIGSDGYPVMSHLTESTGWGSELRVCKCGNTGCSSGNSCNSIFTYAQLGLFSSPGTSLAIGKDGNPVIALGTYYGQNLRFVECNNNSCSGGWRSQFITHPDSATNGSDANKRFVSVAIGTDGYPVASYYDSTNYGVKVAKALPLAEIQTSWGLSGATGDDLTSSVMSGCPTGTYQTGDWHEATGKSNPITISSGNCTELGFMIDTTEATVGIQYRLRLVYADGTALNSYTSYPTLTVVTETNNTKRYSKESVMTSASTCTGGSSSYNCLTVDDSITNAFGSNGNSIAIGTDGYPVISYFDDTADALKVTKCSNSDCSSGNVITTVDDTASNVGQFSSITIGTDGYPVISYFDATAASLKVAKCNDPACQGGDETITTVDDPANVVGSWTSIAIGTEGFPVVSYFDDTADAVKVAKCVNASCTGTSTITTVDDPANVVGIYGTSLAIGTEGYPVIAYTDSTVLTLKVAKCVNASCTGTSTITTVDDPANNVGFYPSIAIGTDTYPVISYYDGTVYSLKVAKCNDTSCTGANETISTVDDPANIVGLISSIAIGTDTYPVISYFDDTADALKVAKCNDTSCTGANETITTVDDPTNLVGSFSSLAIGTDGYPVIAYADLSASSIKVTKELGLPTTASAYFNNGPVVDKQIKFKYTNTDAQFLQHTSFVEDGLKYWLDNKGYSDVGTDENTNRDEVASSSSSEAPVITFIDKFSSGSSNLSVRWNGQSPVACSSATVYLQAYNFNTPGWETITSNTTCSANTDFNIDGLITSNQTRYYLPRYNYDSTKREKDSTGEYFAYWRVYQAAAASQTLKTDLWNPNYSSGLTISGTVYGTNESTALGANLTVKLVNSADPSTSYTDDTDASGNFEITGVTAPTNSDILTLWIDGEGDDGTLVLNYGASCTGTPNCTGLSIYEDRVIIRDENSESITNAMLETCDNDSGTQCSDTEIGFTSGSNALTVSDLRELHIWTGDTYAPAGTVTTSPAADETLADGDIHIDGTGVFTSGGEVSCGGDFTNEGTFTHSNYGVTFTGTDSSPVFQITDGGENFYDVTFNGSGGNWAFQDSTIIEDDLIMTAGTLSGIQNVTVNCTNTGDAGCVTGNATINVTGGTFLVDGTGNFGGSSANWTFYNLTFGDGSGATTTTKTGDNDITITKVLTIASNQTLIAGSDADDTWTLSDSGTPFVISGTFTAQSSIFAFTGNGPTNINSTTYGTLSIGTSNNANIIYTAAGDIIVSQAVSLQSAGSGYKNTFAMQGYNLTVGDVNYASSGGMAVPIRSAFTQSSSGTTSIKSYWWGAMSSPLIGGAGETTFYNLIIGINDIYYVGATLAGNITILNDATIALGDSVDVTVSNYSITAGGNWTNNGNFTCQQGTVTFDDAGSSATKTITDGGEPFYNMVFNGSGDVWTYQDAASSAPTNSTTLQNGTANFINARTGTVSVTGGTLNTDWYLGAHVVSLANPATNIDTGDNDITISEKSSTPQSTIWKYNSGWGSAATSQTTGTGSNGLIPNPITNGAIRIREYTRTSSGPTYYKYNFNVAWQSSYGMYDYYYDYGQNYITSTGNSGSGEDEIIGANWYRATPATNNTEPTINEPPTNGTFYAGMIVGLDVAISDYTIEFGSLTPGGNPTDQTNTITVGTSASNGYIVYGFSTQAMTHTIYPAVTIADWNGSATNANPTTWNNGYFGFGYSTNDYSLTGGTGSRFSGPKFAPFVRTGPGDPVADRTAPTLTTDGQNTITYRTAASGSQAAGPYSTTVVFVVVPKY